MPSSFVTPRRSRPSRASRSSPPSPRTSPTRWGSSRTSPASAAGTAAVPDLPALGRSHGDRESVDPTSAMTAHHHGIVPLAGRGSSIPRSQVSSSSDLSISSSEALPTGSTSDGSGWSVGGDSPVSGHGVGIGLAGSVCGRSSVIRGPPPRWDTPRLSDPHHSPPRPTSPFGRSAPRRQLFIDLRAGLCHHRPSSR
jgi:hypothetical protein